VSISAEAWVLHAAPEGVVERAQLVRETFEFPDLADDEVLGEPLYGSWEGNMGHALERKPIDIARMRGEKKVIIGNGGVIRVLETGPNVKNVEVGQLAMLFAASILDPFGYPKKISGFDAPGTYGVLAKRTVIKDRSLIAIPEDTKFSLPQWAVFSGRYITAWSNFALAHGTLRLLLDDEELPNPHVWAWGGGTSLAELELAIHHGCKTTMLSADDTRLAQIARSGIAALDRRKIGNLTFDERKFTTDLAYRRAYLQAEGAFLKEVQARTDGQGVHIFVDHIGSAVFRATVKALARQGVLATAGWKEGQVISFLRAAECIERHQHVHTHYARYSEGLAAVEFANRRGWMPNVDGGRIYRFDEIPELAESFLRGEHDLFPLFSIAG
jgi:NADPH:quinone reductase-like Zn-dependent oxidoreductase